VAKRPVVPTLPAATVSDPLAEIDAMVALTKDQIFALVGKQGYAAAGNLFDKLLKTRAAIERERAKPGQELGAILAKGSQALAKIRAGRATVEAAEARSRCCARCGAPLVAKEAAA
jgi:hypothetical protein